MNPNLTRWLLRIDWRARAVFSFAGLIACFLALFAGLGIWHRPGLVIAAACLLAGSLIVLAFRGSRGWLSRKDWRLAAIFWASAVSIAATLLGFDLGWDTAAGFLHDVFAGWVASIAFFGFIGLLVAVVSLAQPEEESFESRARILFRGQDGKHIEYIVGRIRETLEHYAEEVSNTFTVVDYRPAERMFLVRVETTTLVRSYLNDVRTTYNSEISMEAEAPPPAGASPNRLLHLRVGTLTWGSKPFQDNGIHQPIDTIMNLPARARSDTASSAGPVRIPSRTPTHPFATPSTPVSRSRINSPKMTPSGSV